MSRQMLCWPIQLALSAGVACEAARGSPRDSALDTRRGERVIQPLPTTSSQPLSMPTTNS